MLPFKMLGAFTLPPQVVFREMANSSTNTAGTRPLCRLPGPWTLYRLSPISLALISSQNAFTINITLIYWGGGEISLNYEIWLFAWISFQLVSMEMYFCSNILVSQEIWLQCLGIVLLMALINPETVQTVRTRSANFISKISSRWNSPSWHLSVPSGHFR